MGFRAQTSRVHASHPRGSCSKSHINFNYYIDTGSSNAGIIGYNNSAVGDAYSMTGTERGVVLVCTLSVQVV